MILYEYTCDDHGSFEVYRPMSARSKPAACPTCGKLCARSYTVPQVAQIDAGSKKAIERNTKSQFEPSRYSPTSGNHEHGAPSSHRPKKPRKAYGGPRSWVMESTV